ncbi:MAG: DUF92 domain-containing protein [Thermoplasmatota archaeon]
MNLLKIGFIVVICLLLAYITYSRKLLNLGGSITAFFVGIILAFQGGITWIILLLFFLGSAFIATRYRFQYKKERGFQEGDRGERGVNNVLANGIIPVLLALFHMPNHDANILHQIGFLEHKLAIFLFITAVAGAASDTLASEMGILSDKTYLITTLKKVRPGVNGGVSVYGEIWAMIGSLYTFTVAYIFFYFFDGDVLPMDWILIGIAMGFVSCQVDSILGALFERKGYIGKSTVNLLSILTSVVITGMIIWMIGY